MMGRKKPKDFFFFGSQRENIKLATLKATKGCFKPSPVSTAAVENESIKSKK